jgi:CheY-like chemotaxis protein
MEVTPSTIPVVEDNKAIAKLFYFVFRKAGYTTVICQTGKEVSEWIENHLPTIVICDIYLPDLSGVGVLTYIRGLKHTSDLTVLAVTAAARIGDKEKLLSDGFTGYISKPINIETFVSEVQKYIKR